MQKTDPINRISSVSSRKSVVYDTTASSTKLDESRVEESIQNSSLHHSKSDLSISSDKNPSDSESLAKVKKVYGSDKKGFNPLGDLASALATAATNTNLRKLTIANDFETSPVMNVFY